MGQKPAAYRYPHAAQDEQFIAYDERWQNHQRQATRHDSRARSHAPDDGPERRIKHRGQPEDE